MWHYTSSRNLNRWYKAENRSMLSCCLIQIKTHQIRKRFPVLYCPALVSFTFIADRMGIQVWFSAAVSHLVRGFTCCAFRDAFFVYLGWNKWLFELLFPLCHLEAAWPFFFDLWHQKDIFTQRTASHWIFSLFRPFSVNTIDGCVGKSH